MSSSISSAESVGEPWLVERIGADRTSLALGRLWWRAHGYLFCLGWHSRTAAAGMHLQQARRNHLGDISGLVVRRLADARCCGHFIEAEL